MTSETATYDATRQAFEGLRTKLRSVRDCL
jgi:hypothetical protein